MPTQHIATVLGNMLRAFGHRVAMCCNISSLELVKFETTTPNMSQHVGWPNARNMLRPTMLRYVVLACCDRLAGALKKKDFFGLDGEFFSKQTFN